MCFHTQKSFFNGCFRKMHIGGGERQLSSFHDSYAIFISSLCSFFVCKTCHSTSAKRVLLPRSRELPLVKLQVGTRFKMSAWKIHYNCLFQVPYDHYGCFPHNEGTYNNAETINLPLMHVGYCVGYCFAMNYPLASLGGNANRYVG